MTQPDRQTFAALARKIALVMGVSALSLGALQPVAAQDDTLQDTPSIGTARPYIPSGMSSNDSALLQQALARQKSPPDLPARLRDDVGMPRDDQPGSNPRTGP